MKPYRFKCWQKQALSSNSRRGDLHFHRSSTLIHEWITSSVSVSVKMNLKYNQLSSEKKKKKRTVKYIKLSSGAIGMLLEPEIRGATEWGIQSFTVLCAFWITFKHLDYKLPFFFFIYVLAVSKLCHAYCGKWCFKYHVRKVIAFQKSLLSKFKSSNHGWVLVFEKAR